MSVHPQHSISTNETLPRITSNKKIVRPPSAPKDNMNPLHTQNPTIASEGESSLRRPRSHSQLNSLSSARKALQSANSSQAVKLEATTLIILKKAEQLQRQDFMIDKEIQAIKREIQELRVKQKFNTDLVQIPTTINSTVSSRLSSNLSKDSQSSKIKNIEILRKKIDRQHQKYKKVANEVDKTRREIQTIKKINKDLEGELTIWKNKMDEESSEVSQLENKINILNQAVQSKKIETVQQKAHIIRDYDAILRKIDEDLKEQGNKDKSETAYFYLTENATPLTSLEGAELRQPSPRNQKNIALQASQLKEKAEQWSGQLDTLKQKLGACSEQELELKLKEKHEINYERYQYLNSRFSHLDELRQRNQELTERRNNIREQYGVEEGRTRKGKELAELKGKIQQSKIKKIKNKQEITKTEELFFNLKTFVLNFGLRTGAFDITEDDITKDNLEGYLESVLKVIKGKS